jgi:hypothetical protein
MCGDIRNFYLGTPMERKEYIGLPIGLIPKEIIDAYNLLPLIHNGHIYMEIHKGMYGLPQASILANNLLTERLAPHGYYQCRHTPVSGDTNGIPFSSPLWLTTLESNASAKHTPTISFRLSSNTTNSKPVGVARSTVGSR